MRNTIINKSFINICIRRGNDPPLVMLSYENTTNNTDIEQLKTREE